MTKDIALTSVADRSVESGMKPMVKYLVTNTVKQDYKYILHW